MNTRRLLNRKKKQGIYYEKHHIIPRVCGGTNDKENLILLTFKEHYIAHLLLTKIYNGELKRKMQYALWRMSHNGKDHERKLSSSQYALCKELFKKAQLGHEVTQETKKRISDANKGRVSKRKGKKFGPLSIDTRNKISKANSGKKRSEETKIKLSNFHKGKLKSEETKNKIKQTKTENPYRHSEEKKKEIGNKSKGRTAWNKGKPMSEESKRKLSIANIGKPGPNKGKPMSEESKRKQSETQLAKHFKHSEETKEKIRRKKLKL